MAAQVQGSMNPFTANDIALAQAVIDSANLALELFRKCGNCTIDLVPLQQQVDSYKRMATGIIQEFGSGDQSE